MKDWKTYKRRARWNLTVKSFKPIKDLKESASHITWNFIALTFILCCWSLLVWAIWKSLLNILIPIIGANFALMGSGLLVLCLFLFTSNFVAEYWAQSKIDVKREALRLQELDTKD